jgi:hypothetical protein
MSIVWQQRIRHFDRPVKNRHMKTFRSQMLKAAVKKRRGKPSGNHSGEYVFASLSLRREARRGKSDPASAAAAARKLLWLRLRERMLEKKRAERRAAQRRRRPSVTDTRINLARHRREYLRSQDEMREKWAKEPLFDGHGFPSGDEPDSASEVA